MENFWKIVKSMILEIHLKNSLSLMVKLKKLKHEYKKSFSLQYWNTAI